MSRFTVAMPCRLDVILILPGYLIGLLALGACVLEGWRGFPGVAEEGEDRIDRPLDETCNRPGEHRDLPLEGTPMIGVPIIGAE
jgi:hypothetical protein